MTLAGKRIATYARFSTDKQNAASTTDQIAKVERWCEAHGGRLSSSLIFRDDAVSGAVRERPGLIALMEAVEAGLVDVLVVEDLGRLSRDTEDSAGIRKRLTYGDCRLVCIDDGIDTASDGAELMGDVMAGFKSLYRREVAKKTLRGLEGRARAGRATGGLPIGYRSVLRTDGAHDIAIDEDGARVVREVFSMYAAGLSLDAVAASLNERGCAPPRGGRSKGEWLQSSVRAILHNARYHGEWSYGTKEFRRDPETRKRLSRPRTAPLVTQTRPELAIVDVATWDAVRARFASSAMRYAGTTHRIPPASESRMSFPLSGLLYCECGAPWTIVGGSKERRYYRCTASRRGTCTEKTNYREIRVRETVLGAIRDRFGGTDGLALLRQIIAEEAANMTGAGDARRMIAAKLARDEAAVAALVRNVERLADDVPDAMLARVRELHAAVKSSRAALARLVADAATPQPALPEPEEVLAGLAAALAGPPAVVRTQLSRLLDGGRLLVSRRPDGRAVVRGGLLPDALIFGEVPPPRAVTTVHCGGQI